MAGTPLNVLLIEDNPGDARLIEVIAAEDPQSALRLTTAPTLADGIARLAATPPDVVLLDLSLPDSHGYDTFARLQAAAPQLPIIVLSGLDDEELAVRTVHHGAQDYLVKGRVDSLLLVRAIRYAIERKRAQEQLRRYALELRSKNSLLREELQMARDVQQALLPQSYPAFPPGVPAEKSALQFLHHYQPTEELGGDFFNLLTLGDAAAGVFICDVMGHGIQSSLVTAVIRGLLEQLRPAGDDPGRLLTAVNHGLLGVLQQTGRLMFATAFYLVLDLRRGELRFANAGHPSPFLASRQTGRVSALGLGKGNHGPALGLFGDAEYVTQSVPLRSRDLVLLYTDGLFEVESDDGELYGPERLMAALRERAHQTPTALFQALLAEINRFGANRGFRDDICLVAAEVAHLLPAQPEME